jgi:GAF domain-containing protein
MWRLDLAQRTDSAEGVGTAWTPSDFALMGRFCPIDELKRALELARLKTDAKGAVLLVADESAVLGTLSLCLPDGDPNFAALAHLLRRGERLRTGGWARKMTKKRRSSLPELIRTSIPARGRTRERFPETAEDLLRVVAELARRNEMEDVGEWLDQTHSRWVPARVPTAARGARMSTAVLLLEPRLHKEAESDGTAVVVIDDDILRLTECVNGTVQASVRRDDLIMRRLDFKLSSSLSEADVDFAKFASGLLEMAVYGSNSEAGACYLIDPASQAMTLQAVYMPQHLRAFWQFAERLPADGGYAALACAGEGQAIQLPPGLLAKPGLKPTCMPRDESAEPILELATPMPGPLGSPSAPAIGAMTLVKLGTGPHPFGAYEVALARNGALRLALISATTKAEQAARIFTTMSRDATHLRRDSLATDMMLRARRQASDSEARMCRNLPDDLEVVLPVIQNVLEHLAQVTQSETVTFRAALPDPLASEPHGVSLVRIATFPAGLADEVEHEVQRDDGTGINWKVACEGTLTYESDVHERRAQSRAPDAPDNQEARRGYVEHHRKTHSELCVPVFVEDRVVGVVNLESPVVHAYDSQIDVCQALAEHVGTAIANARLVLAGVLQAEARDILRKSHDLSHAHEDLRKIASAASPMVARKIETEADRIQREAESLLTFSVDPRQEVTLEGGTTFPNLVNVARGQCLLEFDSLIDHGADWRQHPPHVADLVVKSLVDILDNARRNRAPDHPSITLELDQCEWGGQPQDTLTVRIQVEHKLRPSRAVNVYRCPLSNIEIQYDESREPLRLVDSPQLGAYLAGTHARRAGGDVHLTYGSGNEARVVFSVPSPKKGKHV